MIAWAVFCWVGDDDSGPEDIKDDEDLECETIKMLTLRFASLSSKSLPETGKC
jgi:hypothetical protein